MRSFTFLVLKPAPSIAFLFALVLLSPAISLAQDEKDQPTFPLETIYAERKPWGMRKLLKNFKFSASTGYGHTFFSHKLSGYGVVQPNGFQPRIYPLASPANRYMNWVNAAVPDTLSTAFDGFKVQSDTAKLGFKGGAWNIPIQATVHYEFLGRYRLGGGYSYEYMRIGPLSPITFKDKITDFQPTPRGGFMQKYFGLLGISFYRLDNFLFTGDVQIGGYKPGRNFAKSEIKKGVYVNFGVTVEHEFSEYIKAFIRPSFDIKNYTLNVPYATAGLPHYINAFYVNVGLSYSVPELPRCFQADCRAQMNHTHGNREYRSRMHRIWKKQNPMYGENNPKLLKYKGRNKRKMNPY